MVWACFGSANRCSGLHLITPGYQIAWKIIAQRDQKQAQKVPKMTLFKSDREVSGVTVEAFWDPRSVYRRRLIPVKHKKVIEKANLNAGNGMNRGVTCHFWKVLCDVPCTS
jgi:hypothetical protein